MLARKLQTLRAADSPLPPTQVCRRRGHGARRGVKAGLRPVRAVVRSRQLFFIHMAKKPPATDEGSLLLVVPRGSDAPTAAYSCNASGSMS